MQMQIFLSRSPIYLFLFIVIVMFGCGQAEDEVPESTLTGTISGTVIDADTKNPISGAIVKVSDLAVTTEADGTFSLQGIPYGTDRSLTIQSTYFQTYTYPFSLNQEELTVNAEMNRLSGTVSGVVVDAKTKNPIPGVVVQLFGLEVQTEVDGGFTFQEIPYSEEQNLTAHDPDYHEFTHAFALDKERLVVNVNLTPLKDPEDELNAFLENFSDLVESLDSDNLPAIEALFSEIYVASDDQVTLIGILSGVVPPSFEDVIPTFVNIFQQYSWLQFLFRDKIMDITHARKASAELLLNVDSENAETQDLSHLEAKCTFEFRREGSDWKIVYWQLLKLDVHL